MEYFAKFLPQVFILTLNTSPLAEMSPIWRVLLAASAKPGKDSNDPAKASPTSDDVNAIFMISVTIHILLSSSLNVLSMAMVVGECFVAW